MNSDPLMGPYYHAQHKTFYGDTNITNAFANFRHICPKISDVVPETFKTNVESSLRQVCMSQGLKLTDPDFPPVMESLVDPPNQIKGEYDRNWTNFEWGRASDIFGTAYFKVFQDIDPCDVRQGELGDAYFLSCLSALAESPYLVTRLFDTDIQDEQGIYGVWLCINGIWREVIIDDFLPIIDLGEGVEFAFSRTSEDELWAMALEKAYAKVFGSYYRIEQGDPVHTLRDLTGAPTFRIEDAAFKNPEHLWGKITESEQKGHPMIAYSKKSMVKDNIGNSIGVVSGQAYPVLQAREVTDSYGRYTYIIQLRNPWGAYEWKGDWSHESNLWTPELRNQLGVSNGEDGLHWMSLETFLSHFDGVGYAEVEIGNLYNSLQIKTSQKNEKTMIKFCIDEDSEYTFALDQTDQRFYDESQNYAYSYFRFTIGFINVNKVDFFDCTYSSDKTIYLSGKLPKGNYVALVETYWQSFERDYTFSICGAGRSGIKQMSKNNIDFEKCEYLLWKDFATLHTQAFTQNNMVDVGDGFYQGTMSKSNFQDQKYGLSINRWVFQGSARGLKRGFKATNIAGFELVSEYNHGDEHYMFLSPDRPEVEIFKMDPRSVQGYRFDEEAIDVELCDTDIPDDRAIIDRINSINVILAQFAYSKNPALGNNNAQMKAAATNGMSKSQIASHKYSSAPQQPVNYGNVASQKPTNYGNVAQQPPNYGNVGQQQAVYGQYQNQGQQNGFAQDRHSYHNPLAGKGSAGNPLSAKIGYAGQ